MDAAQLIASLSLEQLAAVYAIRDSILAQHATAEAAFVAINQQLTVDYDAEVVKVTALTAENRRLKPDVIVLDDDQIEWNPRHIAPEQFVKRFNGSQAYNIYTSTDEVLIGGRDLLRHYIVNNYHIDIDDSQVIGLTSHMLTTTPPILTLDERAELLRDSSSSERYQPVA